MQPKDGIAAEGKSARPTKSFLDAMTDLRIHIDVGQPVNRLSRDLLKAIQCASIGLQARDSLVDPLPDLPDTNFQLRPAPEQGWTAANLRPMYGRWILTNALRDAVESVSGFLEEIYKVLCLWSLSERDDLPVQLSSKQATEAFVNRPARFHRLGLPDKITTLATEHDFAIDQNQASQLLSINCARNCFVHRGATVGPRDATGASGLEVQYTTCALFVRGSSDEREVTLPVSVEGGDQIVMRIRPTSKIFPVGSTLDFSVQECSDICATLLRIGHGVHETFAVRYAARNPSG